jgi:hypothetical protein
MDAITETVYSVMGSAIEMVYAYGPIAEKTVVLGKLSSFVITGLQ